MNNFDILSVFKDNLKELLYIGGVVASFFVGRKLRGLRAQKEEVSIQTSELENVETALKIYRTMLSDLQEKLDEAEEALEIIEIRFQESLQENVSLREENKILKEENKRLKDQKNEVTSNNK